MPSSASHPWRHEDILERRARETSYVFQPTQLDGPSLHAIEREWRRRDLEMREYLRDFPLHKWAIKPREARAAYRAFKARRKQEKRGLSMFPNGLFKHVWPEELRIVEEKERLAEIRRVKREEGAFKAMAVSSFMPSYLKLLRLTPWLQKNQAALMDAQSLEELDDAPGPFDSWPQNQAVFMGAENFEKLDDAPGPLSPWPQNQAVFVGAESFEELDDAPGPLLDEPTVVNE